MKTIHLFSVLFAALFLAPCSIVAEEDNFRHVQLSYGISIDAPSHWTELSEENRKNIAAARQAIFDNAGAEGPDGRKETLFAMNAAPSPAGAMIRVSVTSPPTYSQSDLAAATPADLRQLEASFFESSRTLNDYGSAKIINTQSFHLEYINNRLALAMPYVRAEGNGGSPWQVMQYQIPTPERLIQITLSHRQSDAVVWRPILERVKRSLQF
jgi:hypothetical protein